jgi:hypothetical protein
MKTRLNYVLTSLIIVLSLASCATFNVRFESAREWIEGKPFPVRINISKTDKIANVLLHYSFNEGAEKTVGMAQTGSSFTYTIPGEEVKAGVLRYHITYRYKDKGKSLNASPVTILTFEQARRKYTKELSSRISFSPPSQVPINRDARLIVTVKASKPSTRVSFYCKTPEQSSFRETVLKNENGSFVATVSEDELQSGYNTYYFRVTEEHEDVGGLEVLVHDRGSTNPFQFDILTLVQLEKLIRDELYASIAHQAPREVYVTRDLELKLSVSYASNTFIQDFSRSALSAEIFYKSPRSDFKRGVMSGSRNQFSYIVPSVELETGYNAYYFRVTDDIEDIGTVSVEYPASGNLFSYDILSVEEIRGLKTSALFQRISHNPVLTADGISSLYLDLHVKNAGAATSAALYFKKPEINQYKSVSMTREGNIFKGAISIEDQQNGYTQYYFVVTETDEDVGTVSAMFPENGRSRPFRFTVRDKNVIKAELEEELRARLTHRPVISAAEGEDLKLMINVANPKSGTLVYFYHRKPGENSFRQTQLPGNGPQFTMVVPKRDISAGYSQYYFEVREPHSYFGYIAATVASPREPYEFEIRTLKDVILDGIDFTPLSDVEYGVPVTAQITLNNIPSGTRVFFRYRLADDTLDYLSVEMKRDEAVYSTALSSAVLQEGKRIDYFISISVDQEEFTYPDESIIPLYFYVKEQLVDTSGEETVFGTTGRLVSNMLEGRVYQLETGTSELPHSMHKDYQSLIVLYTRKLDIPPRNFMEGFPGLENVFEWFGVQYRGMITIRESGQYNFRLLSDDGSKLFVDSNLVIDNDGTHAPKSKTGGIYLSPGTYPIRVDYFQGPKMQIALQLFVTPPGEEERIFDLKDFE